MSEKVPISHFFLTKLKKMRTKIQVFKNKVFGEVRTMTNESGEKADYCDEVLQSVDCLTTTQIAKEMAMTGPELYRMLIAFGVLYWQSGEYMLYADYARMGLAKSRTCGRRNRLGIWHTVRYLVWTEKGRKFLYDFINHQNR
ncbi:MAG: phage antirepressor KilAC domain-containing protein [Prevotella sp.]|nr:phage antirepressor KilAC domain-containing protein [Prevotella sp.]MBQ9232337.1 phage antirepressor KilAC domain-containing protein [Prevotella sp.]